MKNSAGRGGCCNTIRDLQNFSHPPKAEFNNCFIIHLRTFAQKFSNIDFFLRLLPLKVDELVMSEM